LVTGKESIFKVDEINDFENHGVVNIMTTSKEYSPYIFLENFNDFSDIPQVIRNYMKVHKDILLNRKIKKFDETNWWKYGAIRNIDLMKSDRKRIYGLMKTRDINPFWVGEPGSLFSGGVFALFLKNECNIDINEATDYLNSDKFKNIMKESNLYSNNKVSITPTAFSSLPFNILD
jgi:adenine-specific DNA-methyltransferase